MKRSQRGEQVIRSIVMLVVSVVAFAGCRVQEDAVDSFHLKDFATSYTAAWCSQNPESVAAHFSEEGSLQINDGEPSIGRPAITAAAGAFMTALPDMVVAMDEISGEGDSGVYRWTLTGTNTGPGGTGNEVKISGYEKWTLSADGLIAESRGHFDAAEYDRQLNGDMEGQEPDGL